MDERTPKALGFAVFVLLLSILLFGCSDDPVEGAGVTQEKSIDCPELAIELEQARAELESLKEKLREEDEALKGLLR